MYCRDPAHQIEDSIQVFGYSNPAIAGSSVTYGCSLPGYSLIGSNTSICMGNGEWEPDPRMAIYCKGVSNGKGRATIFNTITDIILTALFTCIQQTVDLLPHLKIVSSFCTQAHWREQK